MRAYACAIIFYYISMYGFFMLNFANPLNFLFLLLYYNETRNNVKWQSISSTF